GNAHPHAAQVLGDEDRLVYRRDLPEAVLEQPVLEAVDALRRAFAAEVLAERAVVRPVHLRVAGEGERHALDLGDRDLAPEDAAHQREELELPALQQLERAGIGARERSEEHTSELQ